VNGIYPTSRIFSIFAISLVTVRIQPKEGNVRDDPVIMSIPEEFHEAFFRFVGQGEGILSKVDVRAPGISSSG
jgi:hypothetical protein